MKIFHGLIFVILIALLGERSYAAYKWKQAADEKGKLAELAATYLFAELPEIKKDGKPVTRAKLIDLFLASAIRNAQTSSAAPPASGGDGVRSQVRP